MSCKVRVVAESQFPEPRESISEQAILLYQNSSQVLRLIVCALSKVFTAMIMYCLRSPILCKNTRDTASWSACKIHLAVEVGWLVSTFGSAVRGSLCNSHAGLL